MWVIQSVCDIATRRDFSFSKVVIKYHNCLDRASCRTAFNQSRIFIDIASVSQQHKSEFLSWNATKVIQDNPPALMNVEQIFCAVNGVCLSA